MNPKYWQRVVNRLAAILSPSVGTDNGGRWSRCRGCPISFLQLAVEPVPAAHWNGIVVQLRNYYRERGGSCTRRADPY